MENQCFNKNQKTRFQKPRSSSSCKIYICSYCGKKFINPQALGGHQNAHRRERQQDKNHKQEMMAIYGTPLMMTPFAFIHPHARFMQHQNIAVSSSSSSSSHHLIEYWPGSCRVQQDEGVPTENLLIQGDIGGDGDNGAEQQVEKGRVEFEIPDLNLDPPFSI